MVSLRIIKDNWGKYVSAIALFAGVCVFFAAEKRSFAGEVEIGVEQLGTGGIELIFEAAPSDAITPSEQNTSSATADVHFEVRANFTENNSFAAEAGGFVPYLNVNMLATNKRSGETVHTTLLPHLNQIDGFHYARNVDLPGDPASTRRFRRAEYDLTFWINPPDIGVVSIHSDFGGQTDQNKIVEPQVFTFSDVNFADVFTGSGPSGSGETPEPVETETPEPTDTGTPDPFETPDPGGGTGSGGVSGGISGSGSSAISVESNGSGKLRLFF